MAFAPKYLRKMICKTLRGDVTKIIKKLCGEMRVEIIEGRSARTTPSFGEHTAVHENSTV